MSVIRSYAARVLARLLFRLARWSPTGPVVALGLRYAGRLLPLRRVWFSPGLIGFYHPQPTWPDHIVLVPTTPIRDLLALCQPRSAPIFADIVLAAGEVLRRLGTSAGSYLLCANGGLRQDVQQVHFHLLRGECWVAPVSSASHALPLVASTDWDVVRHPEPAWQTHVVVVPKPELPPLLRLGKEHIGRLIRLAGAVPVMHRELTLGPTGYTVLIQGNASNEHPLELHLIAGDQIARVPERVDQGAPESR